MADTPSTPEVHPAKVELTARDVPHAPIVYFENSPAIGWLNGIIRVTLTAGLTLPAADGQVISEEVAVAYLRCNIPAALGLRDSIDKALLAAMPTQQAPDAPKN